MEFLGIHGAWSSSVSFNYLRSVIKPKNWHFINYDHASETFEDILNKSYNIIQKPYVAVGHSLGGLIALMQHNDPNCKGIVTLASPLNGIDLSLMQSALSRSTLLTKISRYSPFIEKLHSMVYSKPIVHLLANKGFNPFIYEPNDGVLTLTMQRGWVCGEVIEVSTNHYEILQNDQTVKIIKDFIGKL